MIELKNISKSYDGQKKAVDSLSLSIPAGRIFGFLGPNGAGKTTTLKLITGLLRPDSGELRVNGYSYADDPIKAKASFAFVPDDPNVFLRLRGIEYLNFIADMYDVPALLRKERIQELAARFGLTEALGQRIQAYSHGMRQKVVLIAALLHQPPIWILDEPMTGLDPASAFTLKELMREHADQGNLVLFSTHVLDVAEKICDELAVIDQGKLLFSGSLAALHQVHAEGSLEEIFLNMTREAETASEAPSL